MPWRVAIGRPRTSPKYGSIKQARESAIESMRQWERAIQTRLPWFELHFVEKDDTAPVQVEWKRRTTGSAQGRAGPTCMKSGGHIVAGGRMEVALRACETCDTLTLDEVRMLFAHEFGHVLGLGHCLECDSAMNYSWHTQERIFVTAVDVDAVVRHAEAIYFGRVPPLEPEDLPPLARARDPIPYESAICRRPFRLERSCSREGGAEKHATVGGLDLRLAASEDGSVLLVTIEDRAAWVDQGMATPAANDRFSAVTEATETRGIRAVRATALLERGQVVGYLIEFDGDAWAALRL